MMVHKRSFVCASRSYGAPRWPRLTRAGFTRTLKAMEVLLPENQEAQPNSPTEPGAERMT